MHLLSAKYNAATKSCLEGLYALHDCQQHLLQNSAFNQALHCLHCQILVAFLHFEYFSMTPFCYSSTSATARSEFKVRSYGLSLGMTGSFVNEESKPKRPAGELLREPSPGPPCESEGPFLGEGFTTVKARLSGSPECMCAAASEREAVRDSKKGVKGAKGV